MARKTIKCPECGRTVPIETVACPDCGSYIDDTELSDLEDPEEIYSNSFEEEYQTGEEEEDGIPLFRNEHTEQEIRRLDSLIEVLKKACKEVEQQHAELKRLYKAREAIKKDPYSSLLPLIPLVGTLYEKQRKRVRGVYWIRQMANLLGRGVPTGSIRDWDSDYCVKVLMWLPLEQPVRDEILTTFEAW